jgi:hypothetical protein
MEQGRTANATTTHSVRAAKQRMKAAPAQYAEVATSAMQCTDCELCSPDRYACLFIRPPSSFGDEKAADFSDNVVCKSLCAT